MKLKLLAGLIITSTLTACVIDDVTINLEEQGRYASNVFDESAAEIVTYDKTTKQTFVVNAQSGQIDVIHSADITHPTLNQSVDVKADIEAAFPGKSAGAANSADVYMGLLAVAIEADDKTDDGWIAFYKTSDLSFIKAVQVGALPDMVTFTPNGQQVVVAIEGEPSEDNYAVDPEGEVAVIDVTWNGNTLNTSLTEIGFTDFNAGNPRHSEVPAELILNGHNASVAQDLEPEYVAISANSKKAYVALQENNGIAVIDLTTKTVDTLYALGFKDHSIAGNGFDGNNKDKQALVKPEPALGMYQPDSIATYEYKGKTYLLTANEGDDRSDWIKELDQASCEASNFYYNLDDEECADDITLKDAFDDEVYGPANAAKKLNLTNFDDGGELEDAVNRVKFSHSATMQYGDIDNDGKIDRMMTFGARSFSIWDMTNGQRVYDSGDQFEQITAALYGKEFNQDNAKLKGEDRSDNKGPEPEALTVGKIKTHTFAFIGLERMGGIMVFDITDPQNPEYIEYVNNRDMNVDPDDNEDSNNDGIKEYAVDAGDLGPEGFKFVKSSESPNGKDMLIVGSEVSGTTTFYKINNQVTYQK